jgi:hypothetical protein
MFDFALFPADEQEYVLFLNADGEYVAMAADNSEEIQLEIPAWY